MWEKEKENKERVEKALGTKVTSPKTKKKWRSHFFWKSREVMGSWLSTAKAAGMWCPPQALDAFLQSQIRGQKFRRQKIPIAPGNWKKKRHPPLTPSIHSQQNQLYTYIKARVVRSGKASRRNPEVLWNFRLDICFWLLKRYPQALGTRRIWLQNRNI